MDTFFRPGSVTPTSDDCSSFQAEGSPNHDFASPNLSEGRKTPKPNRASPLLKGLMNPTPRSRSSDNLEKYSPSSSRKASGDASPLTRRLTGDGLIPKDKTASSGTMDSSSSSTLSNKPDDAESLSQLKLKSTPVIAPKQRPWSMVTSEAKTGDLLSDGTSPVNSSGNTPDSADALESPESSSIDRRITKEVKLKRGGMCVVQHFLYFCLFLFYFFSVL